MAQYINVIDAFTSIDDKLAKVIELLTKIASEKVGAPEINYEELVSSSNELISKLSELIDRINYVLVASPTQQPTQTVSKIVSSKVITVPSNLKPSSPQVVSIDSSTDYKYTTSCDLVLIHPEGVDVYINSANTIPLGDNNYVLEDGLHMAVNSKGTEFHFRAVSGSGKLRIWEFCRES